MKHLKSICILISCIFIILLSISCRKDSFIVSPPPCAKCDTLTISTMSINDSNWIRQDDGSYTSDITWIIERSGASVSQVYGINISNESIPLEVFPKVSANYMNGTLYGSVDPSKNHGTCILTFEFSTEEHEGEVHPATSLPFKSVEIEVLLVNRNN